MRRPFVPGKKCDVVDARAKVIFRTEARGAGRGEEVSGSQMSGYDLLESVDESSDSASSLEGFPISSFERSLFSLAVVL